MACASCGRQLESALRFCPMCGRRQSAAFARQSAIEGMLLGALRETEGLHDWRSVLEIVVALCSAVTEAHARGIAELALEPDSFYVERHRSGWVASILDADAAIARRDDVHDTERMRALPPWLTPFHGLYWSPERLMGKPLDGASDVYTLAVIAYELMTGVRPFEKTRGPADLITSQLKTVPRAPSVAARSADIPAACDALLLRALDKDRTKRFATAAWFAGAIATLLDDEPGTAPRMIARPPQAARPAPSGRALPMVVEIIAAKPCGTKTCKTGHRLGASGTKTLVGSWLFLDHYDTAISVQPAGTVHPHVGVATISYLFEGRRLHRDSLGNTQTIERGGLSWMFAGRGVAHSERQPPADLARKARMFGIELRVALPRPNEDDPAVYRYVRAADLPSVVIGGVRVRVVIGEGFGAASPLTFPSALALYDVRLPANAAVPLPLPRYHDYQRAVYVVSGAVEIGETVVDARNLVVLQPGASIGIRASGGKPAHIIGLGSAPVLGPRYTWWYFTSTSLARIDEAKRRWVAGEIGSVPNDPSRAPLPRG